MWYNYTMEYYSDIKSKDINSAGKWMELESIILSEETQSLKDMHDMPSLISRSYLQNVGTMLHFTYPKKLKTRRKAQVREPGPQGKGSEIVIRGRWREGIRREGV